MKLTPGDSVYVGRSPALQTPREIAGKVGTFLGMNGGYALVDVPGVPAIVDGIALKGWSVHPEQLQATDNPEEKT